MLLFRSLPFLGESLSSWRQRIGQDNGYWRYPRPPYTSVNLDPDRLRNDEEAEWISRLTGLEAAQILALTLDVAASSISDNAPSSKVRWAITPRQDLTHRCGPMYCPRCLATDEVPYFRISWRLAHQAYCPIHRIYFVDSCFRCQGAAWPSSQRNTKLKRWLTLRYCQNCGEDLAAQPVLCVEAKIDEVPLADSIDIKSYWDGVHALCQLMLRTSGRALAFSGELPLVLGQTADLQSWQRIEEVSLITRFRIVQNSRSLLVDWPVHFERAALKAGLSKVSFSGQSVPAWMKLTIDSRLAQRRRNQFSHSHIMSTIEDEIARSGTASKSKIRRILGVSDNAVLNSIMSQRFRASHAELSQMVGHFQAAIAGSRIGRSMLESLRRDYLIFLLSALSGTPVKEVCGWAIEDVHRVLDSNLTSTDQEDAARLQMRAEANNELIAYKANRDTFNKCISEQFFLSRFGAPLAEHSIRARVCFLMRDRFDTNLVRSIDVFTSSLKQAAKTVPTTPPGAAG